MNNKHVNSRECWHIIFYYNREFSLKKTTSTWVVFGDEKTLSNVYCCVSLLPPNDTFTSLSEGNSSVASMPDFSPSRISLSFIGRNLQITRTEDMLIVEFKWLGKNDRQCCHAGVFRLSFPLHEWKLWRALNNDVVEQWREWEEKIFFATTECVVSAKWQGRVEDSSDGLQGIGPVSVVQRSSEQWWFSRSGEERGNLVQDLEATFQLWSIHNGCLLPVAQELWAILARVRIPLLSWSSSVSGKHQTS